MACSHYNKYFTAKIFKNLSLDQAVRSHARHNFSKTLRLHIALAIYFVFFFFFLNMESDFDCKLCGAFFGAFF